MWWRKDEDEECYTMLQDNESSSVATNDKKCKSKATEVCVDECDHKEACKVAECEGDFKKECEGVEGLNVNLDKYLKKDDEKACVKCEKLQENSAHVDVTHEMLVDELKKRTL